MLHTSCVTLTRKSGEYGLNAGYSRQDNVLNQGGCIMKRVSWGFDATCATYTVKRFLTAHVIRKRLAIRRLRY